MDQILADEVADSTPGEAADVLWPLLDHQNTVHDLAVYDVTLNETTVASHRVFDAFGRLLTEPDGHLFAFTGSSPSPAARSIRRPAFRTTSTGGMVRPSPSGSPKTR